MQENQTIRDAPLINISSSNRRQMALMYKGVEIYGIKRDKILNVILELYLQNKTIF